MFFISDTPIVDIQVRLACPESCPTNDDVPKSPSLSLAAMVLIGRVFNYLRWFVPWVPSAS